VFVQQAIFTSVRSGRNEGYQLAAMSPGVAQEDARELAQWGPGHDSLYDRHAGAECVSFQRLRSGWYCVAWSSLAGREYSGRAGQRVYTQCFLIAAESLSRFANNPFRILEAMIAGGHATVLDPIPRALDPVPLLGRASAANLDAVEQVCRACGPERLACLVNAALETDRLGIASDVAPSRLFSVLLDLLPLPLRPEFSLTTGLKVSLRRPFRLVALPADRESQREAARLVALTPLSVDADLPTQFAPRSGWSLLILELLRDRQYQRIGQIVSDTAAQAETPPDWLAEHIMGDLERLAGSAGILFPWSASGRETVQTNTNCRVDQPMLPDGTAH
jgi:hypothetical protein